ncbi:hypothetical protein DFJ43DRAFT_1086004 [Lentinula guzmanii]|uniref:Uncharacterized protein n=2 Tax=Lentinula TaxID=5352 RepID=A0AA38J754_9AGAR|nr:hypothetical protein DFJ43DRAFT_1086004 [Lentinula guzmanii]KAJ3789393.1 hypothetical protein GGU10DRAFT_425658 [Lentinula aff. detonsa]
MLPKPSASIGSISKVSAPLISSYLKELCYNPNNANYIHSRRIFEGILYPCVKTKKHYVSGPGGKVHSVRVPFHEHKEMEISDYFSALGYVLTYSTRTASFIQLIHLLSHYAEWCRVSSFVLGINTPTVVQMLFDDPPSSKLTPFHTLAHHGYGNKFKFSLASSISAGKGEGREDVRSSRISALQSVWPHHLIHPTPVQRAHASAGIGYGRSSIETSAELFGTPWGHCGESVSFPSMHQSITSGHPLGTLALSVKAMNCVIPGTNTIPVQTIPFLTSITDIIELLKVAGALRPMCLNCLYLRNNARGCIQDYATKYSVSGDNVG